MFLKGGSRATVKQRWRVEKKEAVRKRGGQWWVAESGQAGWTDDGAGVRKVM